MGPDSCYSRIGVALFDRNGSDQWDCSTEELHNSVGIPFVFYNIISSYI